MTTKVFKRLEGNSVRGAFKDPPKNLLLPVSLGITSIAMLCILDEQLRTHLERSGRASYRLHVLYINKPLLVERADRERSLDLLKERFPLHTYSSVSLEDVFDYGLNFQKEMFGVQSSKNATEDKQARLQHLMDNLPSATSRTDIANILRQMITVEFAKQRGCDAILYGDSTTRLAERTLAETAKGRGGSLPWLTADGLLPCGVKIAYPMRDLLKKEISTYASMISPPLTTLILDRGSTGQTSVSSRSTTIDALMSQYFESVEQNYPSIVANVVRTSSKLRASSSSPTTPLCNICKLPVLRDSHRWAGNQSIYTDTCIEDKTDGGAICYGCTRSIKIAG